MGGWGVGLGGGGESKGAFITSPSFMLNGVYVLVGGLCSSNSVSLSLGVIAACGGVHGSKGHVHGCVAPLPRNNHPERGWGTYYARVRVPPIILRPPVAEQCTVEAHFPASLRRWGVARCRGHRTGRCATMLACEPRQVCPPLHR